MEVCICCQRFYIGSECFHIKLGLTSAIEIRHQYMMEKKLDGNLQNAQGNTANELKKYFKETYG